MEDRLRKAFAAVEVEEGLKEKTRATLLEKAQGRRARPRRRAVCAVAMASLLLFVGVGTGVFFTPVSAISIDINPSIELGVNRFDQVVAVKGYNQVGQELLASIDLRFMDYSPALAALLADDRVQAYREQGESLSIFVACDDQQKGDEMLSKVETCAGGGPGVHCLSGNWAESQAAQAAGLSCGKYRAFLELQALDPSAAPEDVQGLTMREIRERIAALSGGEVPASPGQGCGHHGGHGHACQAG